MTPQFVLFALVTIGLVSLSKCYPTGAPKETCKSFTANHTGYQASDTKSKYVLKISPSSLTSGSKATVTLEGDIFKGFFVQAEDVNTKEPVGKFTAQNGVSQTVDCSGPGSATAVTHVEPSDKPSVNLEWHAPASYKGSVVFRAVVVKTHEVFWNNIRSNTVSIA